MTTHHGSYYYYCDLPAKQKNKKPVKPEGAAPDLAQDAADQQENYELLQKEEAETENQ